MSWVGAWLGAGPGSTDGDESPPLPVPVPETPTLGATIERDDTIARSLDRLPQQFRSDP